MSQDNSKIKKKSKKCKKPSKTNGFFYFLANGQRIPCSAVLGVGPSNAASVLNVNNPRGVTFSRVKSLRVHTAAAVRREKPQ